MNDKIFKRCVLALGIVAIFLCWLGLYTNIDLNLADWMFDFSRHEFTWQHSWFATFFMHESMKIALIAFGVALFLVLLVDGTVLPGFLAVEVRQGLRMVVASSISIPLVISLVKSRSIHACPWDLKRYGGSEPYLRIFESMPVDAVAGHCFPAGHASSGLWLAAFAVFLLPKRPWLAVLAFTVGLLPGAILGWVQQMRGAHFLTHTLWSMWYASLVILILARWLYSPSKIDVIALTQLGSAEKPKLRSLDL